MCFVAEVTRYAHKRRRVKMKNCSVFLSVAIAIVMVFSGTAFSEPMGVSPGGSGTSPACPTFSWAQVEGAVSYELSAYLSPGLGVLPVEDMDAATGGPVLAHKIPAPALSWTPSSGQCLAEGSYIWYVRGVDAEGNGQWSSGTAFEVGEVLTEAVFEKRVADAVEKYLQHQQESAKINESGVAMYKIVGSRTVMDKMAKDKAGLSSSAATPNAATPTTGASVYVDGDVSLANGGGRVGIGTDAISAGLHVTSNDGVLFEGAYNLGAIPKEGAGGRMMWYPGKSAFRVGYIDGTQWDDANIGTYSIAAGNGTTASGNYSTAMGYGTRASGYSSTAMGAYTTASATYSTAMGYSTRASGMYSTAMGRSAYAESFAETAIGHNNTLASSPTYNTWVSTDRLFVIGNGSGVDRSNAMVVLKNGHTGIGVSNPQVRLDLGPAVDANGAPGSGVLQIGGNLRMDNNEIITNTDSALYLQFDNNGDLIVDINTLCVDASADRVGIGTSTPSMKLYVNGSAGGTQAWNASDARLKTNVETIERALEGIEQIRGVSYRWKDGDEEETKGYDDRTHYGVIAQEVEEVFPDLVDQQGETQAYKHLEYNGLVGILVAAVKELKHQNDELREIVCSHHPGAAACR